MQQDLRDGTSNTLRFCNANVDVIISPLLTVVFLIANCQQLYEVVQSLQGH
jgi:hypothetical protein